MSNKVAPPQVPMIEARWKGGSQTPALIVMHATVGPTKAGSARGVAHFFQTESTPTSAHYICDEAEVIQTVGDHTVAYHCGYNENSIGIEQCIVPIIDSEKNWLLPPSQRGKPRQHTKVTPLSWLRGDVKHMMRNSAKTAAQLGLAYGIPLRLLSNSQLETWANKGKVPAFGGIVTHQQMTDVFKDSTHWDPGAWPSDRWMVMVQNSARALKAAA